MKQINDPGTIDVVNLLGDPQFEPVIGPDGYPSLETVDGQRRQKVKPARITLRDFCLSLLALPPFVGEAKGLDAAALVFEARGALLAWPDGPGPKALENEHHRGLVRCVKAHDFGAGGYNLVPFMRAIAEAVDVPAAAAAPAANDEG